MNRLRLLVSDTQMRMEKSALSVEKCVNFDEATAWISSRFFGAGMRCIRVR